MNTPGASLQERGEPTLSPVPDEPFLCFQRQAPGDVVLTLAADSDSNAALAKGTTGQFCTHKILGSAQRRHRGATLQHGSLLVEKSPFAPELTGWCDLADANTTIDELTTAVCTELARTLKFRFVPYQLSHELQSQATQLAKNKYGSTAWTNRR